MPWQLIKIWKLTYSFHLQLTDTAERGNFCLQYRGAVLPLPSSLSRTDKRLPLATVSFGRYLLKPFCTLTMVYTAQHCHQASLQVLSSCWFPHRKEVSSMIKSPGWEERPGRMCLISLLGRQLIVITIDNLESGHYFCITGLTHFKK